MQFDLRTMAEHMGGVAWAVVIVLFIMSMYSIAVMIERYWTFKKATDQSRSYAPEAARACQAYGFGPLDADRLISLIRPENVPSLRVAEKTGLTLWKEVVWKDLAHYVYAIRKT